MLGVIDISTQSCQATWNDLREFLDQFFFTGIELGIDLGIDLDARATAYSAAILGINGYHCAAVLVVPSSGPEMSIT